MNNPDLAADPANAAKISAWFWKINVSKRGAGEHATKATKLVNGGYIGLEDRQKKAAEWEAKIRAWNEPVVMPAVCGDKCAQQSAVFRDRIAARTGQAGALGRMQLRLNPGGGMLQKLGEWWQGRALVKKLERHPVHGPVLINLRTVINDKSQGIGKYWSDAGKQGLVSKVLTDLDAQLSQPDPVQRVRMRLIEFMMLAASFQVLVLQPPSKVDGISGELKPAI